MERKPGRAKRYLKVLYQSEFSLLSDLVLLKSKSVAQEVSNKLVANMKKLSRVETLSLGIDSFEDPDVELLKAQGAVPQNAVK